ncbi:hypothetical protein VQ366_003946 [Salmonella enterica]|nr:hypothetical protein [Salmonella enterica]EBQ9779260.1 hypothetical protein [Salmonella enterica subsp. enterica serovar Inganda]EBU7308194.1 hypothetical protein [Salmonella enterica subsp. enterica serovar Panama]EHN6577946.1 hypothetical protein [Salmonella enterica subsp. enterica serovar Anecho]EBA1296006.1 hypothetical protein [Salmonella enterica]
MPDIRLPSWMNRGDIVRLKNTFVRFWEQVHTWVTWPLRQTDPLTCTESILNLTAWQYDITRFDGEPLSLYRRRVKYAFANAQDAGSVAGFRAIFERLGIGYVEIMERQPGIDWDVILLHVTDSQLSQNTALLNQIVQQYGRTCRRYRIQVINATIDITGYGVICGEWRYFYAEEKNDTDRYHFSL